MESEEVSLRDQVDGQERTKENREERIHTTGADVTNAVAGHIVQSVLEQVERESEK
jgi:hypothetical protein